MSERVVVVEQLDDLAVKLSSVSRVLQKVAIVGAILDVIAGIWMTAKDSNHIYGQAAGIDVIILGLIGSATAWAFFRALEVFAEYVRFKNTEVR